MSAALQQEAQQFLNDRGIDEPLIWNPPQRLLAGLTLPGPDPTSIDVANLHQLVRESLPLSDIAERLDTSLGAVRHVLTLHPGPELHRSSAFRPAPALSDLAQRLTSSELNDLYLQQKLPLKDIAARYGAGRQLVARLARQYGITLRPAQAPRRHDEIDKDWLHNEYVLNQRTLPELAAEKAMSTMNMARWAKHHGIPLRGRGGPSHTATLNAAKAADTAPTLLKTALTAIGGAERLARFAAASHYPSVTTAAAELGLRQPVLHTQIGRLATDFGGPLLTPAERNHPMTLTPLGRRALQAWNDWNTTHDEHVPVRVDFR